MVGVALRIEEEVASARVHAASLVLKLRSLGIVDRAVLRAVESVPRALFVPPCFAAFADLDVRIPIDCGQTADAPSDLARVVSALDLCDRHSVLEIGTGSGYGAAILARLARRVTTLDRYRTLVRAAEARFALLRLRNVSLAAADGLRGWPRQAPFDRIVVGAALPAPPVRLLAQLTGTGMLIAAIRSGSAGQRLTLFQRIGRRVEARDLGPADAPPAVPGLAQVM